MSQLPLQVVIVVAFGALFVCCLFACSRTVRVVADFGDEAGAGQKSVASTGALPPRKFISEILDPSAPTTQRSACNLLQ
jgi:hypothetical protein